MNVTLPDGTVIKNVPDGITKAQLATRLKSSGYNVPDTWLPRESPASAAKRAALKTAQAKTDAQYDAAIKAAQPNAAESFIAGMGHHLGNAVIGPAQLVLHAANAVSGGNLQDVTNAADKWVANNESDYQQAIPTNAASVTGAAFGELLPFVMGDAIPKGLQFVGDKAASLLPEGWSLARRLASGATQGTILSAAQPVTNAGNTNTLSDLVTGTYHKTPEYWFQKAKQMLSGAGLGAALPLAGAVTRPLTNFAANVFRPQSVADENIARLYGANSANVNALRYAPTFVAGSRPTTAQVLGGANAVAAEKAFGNTPLGKNALAEHAATANDARVNALRSLAGDDAAMQAAREARAAAVKPFTSKYLVDTLPITRWTNAGKALDEAQRRMSGQDFDAVKAARKIVNDVRSGKMQEDDAFEELSEVEKSAGGKKARDAINNAMGEIDRNMTDPTGVLNTLKTLRYGSLGVDKRRADVLDNVIASIEKARNIRGKVGIDMLDAARQQADKLFSGASSQDRIAYGKARDSIVAALNRAAPGYSDYLATYARASAPINTMETARGALAPADTGALDIGHSGTLTLARVNAAIKQAEKSQYGATPQVLNTLRSIRNDLQRESVSNSLRSPGSDTAYNLQMRGALANAMSKQHPALRQIVRGAGGAIGAALGAHGSGYEGAAIGAAAGYGLSEALTASAGKLNDRVMARFAKGVMDPKEAAASIERFLASHKKEAPKLLRRYPQWRALIAPQRTLPGTL